MLDGKSYVTSRGLRASFEGASTGGLPFERLPQSGQKLCRPTTDFFFFFSSLLFFALFVVRDERVRETLRENTLEFLILNPDSGNFESFLGVFFFFFLFNV